jgi:hypothetical protein
MRYWRPPDRVAILKQKTRWRVTGDRDVTMQLTKTAVVEILNGAFKPLTSVARLTDQENAIELSLTAANGTHVPTWRCSPLDAVRDNDELTSTILQLRTRLDA